MSQFTAGEQRDTFFLMVGGFVPYKTEQVAIEAFRALRLPLVVAGDGPLRKRLQAHAPPNVTFIGRVSDTDLAGLYARCRALIYPQEEDFGLIAVEAQASGAPVIAYGRGGATETVIPIDDPEQRPPTGLFFPAQTPDSLVEAIHRFEQVQAAFDPRAIRDHAQRFSTDAFRRGMRSEIDAMFSSYVFPP